MRRLDPVGINILNPLDYAPTGPDPNIDLVSLYGLGPIASTVARTDPVTGEKINRLRKSYEGKIKGLGLAGRNKASRREPSSPNSLLAICSWPEEEWQNQKVIGHEMRVAEPDSEQYQRLMKAMKMEPGPLPNQEFWEDALGHEKPAKALPTDLKSNAHLARQSNGGVSPSVSPAPSVAESIRPRRVGKKRSYQDNSFMGYGEGFLDDDADIDPDFHSNDGDEGGKGGKKKRKRVWTVSWLPSISIGQTDSFYRITLQLRPSPSEVAVTASACSSAGDKNDHVMSTITKKQKNFTVNRGCDSASALFPVLHRYLSLRCIHFIDYHTGIHT